jgi:hypothetical protein
MAGADRSCGYGVNRWKADPRIAGLRDRNEILVGTRDAKVCNRKDGKESGRITMRIDGPPSQECGHERPPGAGGRVPLHRSNLQSPPDTFEQRFVVERF